jgi:hypothetical protein
MSLESNRIEEELAEIEIDLHELAQREADVPLARAYKVRIDGEIVRVDTPSPTGRQLLGKVHKRPCAYELVEEFVRRESRVVEPDEIVNLRRKGLKGFITAHKEIVTIFIGGEDHPFPIERGERTVAEILGKVGKTPEGYVLLEEKNGPPMPLPPNLPVKICGCEMFYVQPQSGGSS